VLHSEEQEADVEQVANVEVEAHMEREAQVEVQAHVGREAPRRRTVGRTMVRRRMQDRGVASSRSTTG
jgi:hypothetical protein